MTAQISGPGLGPFCRIGLLATTGRALVRNDTRYLREGADTLILVLLHNQHRDALGQLQGYGRRPEQHLAVVDGQIFDIAFVERNERGQTQVLKLYLLERNTGMGLTAFDYELVAIMRKPTLL